MKEFIRIVQTDAIDIPEIHESEIDVTGLALDSLAVVAIKNSLSELIVSEKSKFQKHYHDHNDPIVTGCILEDL